MGTVREDKMYIEERIKDIRTKTAKWIENTYRGTRPGTVYKGACIVCKRETTCDWEHVCLMCYVNMSDFQVFLISRKHK